VGLATGVYFSELYEFEKAIKKTIKKKGELGQRRSEYLRKNRRRVLAVEVHRFKRGRLS